MQTFVEQQLSLPSHSSPLLEQHVPPHTTVVQQFPLESQPTELAEQQLPPQSIVEQHCPDDVQPTLPDGQQVPPQVVVGHWHWLLEHVAGAGHGPQSIDFPQLSFVGPHS